MKQLLHPNFRDLLNRNFNGFGTKKGNFLNFWQLHLKITRSAAPVNQNKTIRRKLEVGAEKCLKKLEPETPKSKVLESEIMIFRKMWKELQFVRKTLK